MSDRNEIVAPARSFPEFRSFLEQEIMGPDYPIKHLIEQARNKGHISRGKPGRGGAAVTSRDAAMILAGALCGDTPAIASDAMEKLAKLKPNESTLGVHLPVYPLLYENWWYRPFIEAFSMIIDAWREDDNLDFHDFEVSVTREPRISARIRWNDIPGERDEFVVYVDDNPIALDNTMTSRRSVRASLFGETLKMVADWLEGRSRYCE